MGREKMSTHFLTILVKKSRFRTDKWGTRWVRSSMSVCHFYLSRLENNPSIIWLIHCIVAFFAIIIYQSNSMKRPYMDDGMEGPSGQGQNDQPSFSGPFRTAKEQLVNTLVLYSSMTSPWDKKLYYQRLKGFWLFYFLHRILRTRKSLGEGEERYQRLPMELPRSLWVQGLLLFFFKIYVK